MAYSVEQAKVLLNAAEVFFDTDDDDKQMLNLNDAMYWGCADGEHVSDEELPRVAELFFNYGWCGILYWVAVEKRGGDKAEFVDVRRMVQFVTNEELVRSEEPNSSKRAYLKRQYTIGDD